MAFPIIAAGAVLAGGLLVKAIASTQDAPPQRTKENTAQQKVLPQSYLVTPVSSDPAQQLSALEAVNKFIV